MSDDIRAIYLRLVKLVHTDTAPMDEFSVRTMTMQILNDAYKRRDLGALRALVVCHA